MVYIIYYLMNIQINMVDQCIMLDVIYVDGKLH